MCQQVCFVIQIILVVLKFVKKNADCSMFGQEVLDRWTLETHLPQSHHYAYRATL